MSVQTGNVDLTCVSFMSWRTTDFRSPIGSAAPSRLVNFLCWKMERSASWVGAQVARVRWRQKSLSEALIETTRLRFSGFSGEATHMELPSARDSVGAALSAMSSAAIALVGAEGFSARTDMLLVTSDSVTLVANSSTPGCHLCKIQHGFSPVALSYFTLRQCTTTATTTTTDAPT